MNLQPPGEPSRPRPVVVGVTGASGSIYALRLIEELAARRIPVELVASSAGRQVIAHEIPDRASSSEEIFSDLPRDLVRTHHERDFFAPFCSGSFATRAVIIVPCSLGTVGALASGVSANSIHRAGDVALKERTPLILVPRETPLSTIHLENLLTLSRSGAVILPPVTAFYQHPRTQDDQVNFIVSRILDQLRLDNDLFPRWGQDAEASPP